MDRRLQERYVKLMAAHLHMATKLAAGVSPLPDGDGSMAAATQAAWRFFNNERVPLPALAEPLRQAGRDAAEATTASCMLLVHDWSTLAYGTHASKQDRLQLTHAHDIGYDLTTALLVRADDGAPVAPMEMHLKTGAGVLSTRTPAPAAAHHLDQVLPTMQAVAAWRLAKPVVHVIDREADAVGHFRVWATAGFHFLVRADDRRVRWRGTSRLLTEIAGDWQATHAFRDVRKVEFHGRTAQQQVAETEVILDRPAKQRQGDRQVEVPGPPLPLRLVMTRVVDEDGTLLAEWFLLTNVPAAWATAEQIALWYYWRWRIESFFKLLKSAGQELEHWQQETGGAIARRLLVAAAACVVVWQLERQHTPEAEELKHVLVQLSGRQMEHGRLYTAPALLAGLQVLLRMLALMQHHDLPSLTRLVAATLPILHRDTG